MKKYLPIILGFLFLVAGLYLYSGHSSIPLPVADNLMLTKDEAVSVLGDTIIDVIKVYESPTSIFEIETETREDGTIISNVKNYQDVISGIFSEKGISELESTKFSGKNYVIKENDGLAFDHPKVVVSGISRLKNKIEYTDIVFNMMGEYFTLGELQKVYEVILGKKLLDPAFRRIINNKVVKTDKIKKGEGHRPSYLYKSSYFLYLYKQFQLKFLI